MPKMLVFASGGRDSGGSGFRRLVDASLRGILSAEIVGVVSNHESGGVRHIADSLGVPFRHFPGPWGAEGYRRIAGESGAEWFALSGWLKLVVGLDPTRTFNIHPAPLPRFGGRGMYGSRVHKAVLAAYRRGEVGASAVAMHFVTEEYDGGPVFFRWPVEIKSDDTAATLGRRVQETEHFWQPWATDLVVRGAIRWDGVNRDSLAVPHWYRLHEAPAG
jgi:phosphoribosylglycinamide formyltransferase-1